MKKSNPQIEIALRHFVDKMINDPDVYSQEDGQIIDRALRSCPGIIDIDCIWVRWRFIGEPRGWLTGEEMVIKNGKYTFNKITTCDCNGCKMFLMYNQKET